MPGVLHIGVIVEVGLILSYNLVNCVAAELGFPAASVATPALTSTDTVPSVVGVISKSYTIPLPVKLPAVPFVTVISPTTKFVVDSPNVALTFIVPFVGSGSLEVRVTVGPAVSTVNEGTESRDEVFVAASVTVTVQLLYVPSVSVVKVIVFDPDVAEVVAELHDPAYDIVPASVEEKI